MSRSFIVLPAADADLREHFTYLAQDSLDAATRFLTAAEATFEQLAEMPGIGVVRNFRSPRLADVRQWRVRGFENHLIFYRQIQEAIEILRVLHGARDIEHALEE